MAGIRLGTEDLVFKLGNSDCKVYIGDTLLYQPYSPSGQTPCFEVVDALSGASGDYVDVYNTSDSKWYKKNNLNEYEEYGIMPTVDALTGVTYYVGKLVVLSTDNHEYKWTGSSWTDLGEVVTSGTSEYFLAASDSSLSAVFKPGYYWGEGYYMMLDVAFLNGNTFITLEHNNTSPFEFTNYGTGFYSDFHAPESTSDNSCYSGDNTNRAMLSSSNVPKDGTRLKFKLEVNKFTIYNYETGVQLAQNGKIYTGYSWYDGLYKVVIRSSNSVPFRLGGYKVYDNNGNLVNDVIVRFRDNTSADKQIYLHDNVLNVDYENERENPVGYYEIKGEQATVYPEDYDTKVAPPDNVVYSTLAELELMECPWTGMHATVGGVPYIYTANGWEVNTTPYTQYDYVQGNGTSYIITDYKPNANSSVEIDIEGRQVSGISDYESHFFGSCHYDPDNGNAGSKRFKLIYYGTVALRYDYALNQVAYNNNAINSRGVIKMDSTGGYWNDTKVVTFTNSIDMSDNQCVASIFDTCWYNIKTGETIMLSSLGGKRYKGKIYSVKFYEGETLIRNFVPAEKDGVCGMYETITGTMYGSANSTPFTVGNE